MDPRASGTAKTTTHITASAGGIFRSLSLIPRPKDHLASGRRLGVLWMGTCVTLSRSVDAINFFICENEGFSTLKVTMEKSKNNINIF